MKQNFEYTGTFVTLNFEKMSKQEELIAKLEKLNLSQERNIIIAILTEDGVDSEKAIPEMIREMSLDPPPTIHHAASMAYKIAVKHGSRPLKCYH